MNPEFKRNISKIAAVSIIWYISSLVFLFIEKGVLGTLSYYPSTGNQFNFYRSLFVGPFFSMIAGTILGAIEVFWLNKQFRNTTFGRKILLKTLFYLIAIVAFTFLGTVISNSFTLDEPILSKQVLNSVINFFGDFAYISIISYVAFILVGTLFFLEVSDNLGQGVLRNFLIGKYHKPREEERIFMFLDLKSSTTIAEKVGHIQYFNFLNEYYQDITRSIIRSYGVIYQYVGDEVVITWSMDEGLKNAHCIQLYFQMEHKIDQIKGKYEQKYGIVPSFKAGVHCGKVTVGEIGSIKKEIVYSGDVLNTTARIQALCNSYNSKMLISSELLHKLSPLDKDFKTDEIGEMTLRGKDKKVKIYSVVVDR